MFHASVLSGRQRQRILLALALVAAFSTILSVTAFL
jgi:hypothetical protein